MLRRHVTTGEFTYMTRELSESPIHLHKFPVVISDNIVTIIHHSFMHMNSPHDSRVCLTCCTRHDRIR